MKVKPTSHDFHLFAEHCVSVLPDGIAHRKIFLNCLLYGLPKKHSDRPRLAELIHHLQAHEKAQAEFCFQFPSKPSHDGHHGKDGHE